MNIWLRQHGFALRQAFRNALGAPASFLINAVVIAIAFALPLTGLTILENLRPLSGQLVVEPEISVFIDMAVTRNDALALGKDIRRVLQENKHPGKVEFLPREKALDLLKQQSGLSETLDILGTNPLPDGYLIKLPRFDNAADAGAVDAIATSLQALAGIKHVQVDSAWIKRLAALVHLLGVVLVILASTLGIVVVTVVFNTIRLQVLTQREEIAVSQLVGATDTFIYRPFYYTGALLGLCAAGLAMVAVALVLRPVNAAVADFARLYASEFTLVPLDPLATMLLLGLGALLGVAGAVLSVSRHLSASATS
ncbi:Cell division protein FtsX [Oxalobacteraceae bacterium IMCC9480]|jgi:cell division transport system permease protein|nr:Cell division protein FtsX [Oxalobacteraceae bacterium IMCC9480]NDP58353.1 ABC transporter permease [Oxalobacteraceae bacterium]